LILKTILPDDDDDDDDDDDEQAPSHKRTVACYLQGIPCSFDHISLLQIASRSPMIFS